MSWITDNRGEGPWDFVAQKDKLGYVNNPRWTATPASLLEHEPCGYWWKAKALAPLITNIYALSRDRGFWGAYFNGTSLVYIGDYNGGSSHWFTGPTRYEESLLITNGIGPSPPPTILRISLQSPFVLQQTHSPFLDNDLSDKIPFKWGPGKVNGKYYVFQGSSTGGVAPGAYVGSNFVRLDSGLNREARGYWCTVVTGTDGNLYQSKTVLIPTSGAWAANYRPITGANWALAWKLHPDMICDSPITPWGSGPIYSGASSAAHWMYYNNHIYVTSSGGPSIGVRKLDPDTFEILTTNGGEANPFDTTKRGHHPVGHSGRIYVISGTTASPNDYNTVRAYDATTLSLLTTSVDIDSTDPHNVVGNGLIAGTSELICWVKSSGNGVYTFYKLDYDSLAIIASNTITLPAVGTYPPNGLDLQNYNNDYWLAIYYRGIGVIQASTMTLVQTIDLIPQGWDVNLALDGILGTDAQTSTSSPIPLVNPVWTMPA